MKDSEFVKLILLVAREDAEAIKKNPSAFQGIQERASSGQIASVVKAMVGNGGMTNDHKLPDGSPLTPINVEVERHQAERLLANAEAMAIREQFARVCDELAVMNSRMESVEVGIGRIDRTAGQTLAALRRGPLSELRSAWTSALVAKRRNDHVTLAAAAKGAERAAHDLLGFAESLADGTQGLPLALQAPSEFVEIMRSSHHAMLIAGTIYGEMGETDVAATLVREHAAAMNGMRESLRTILTSPEYIKDRLSGTMAPDDVVIAAGHMLAAETRQAVINAESMSRGVTIDAEGFFTLNGNKLVFLMLEAGAAVAMVTDTKKIEPET